MGGGSNDKKENQIFLIFKEIQNGEVEKSYMREGFLIYEDMRKYFPIYEEAVSPILYTVSWRIRIFNCIEEVPRFFFPIEFNSAFQISNYLQFNSTRYTI